MQKLEATPEKMLKLYSAVEKSWGRETSASPDRWTEERPEIGQCAVTALIVQAAFGGELLRVINNGESHYFNRLPTGRTLDWTRAQFDRWNPSISEERSRDYVTSFDETWNRYIILHDRVMEALVP